MYMAAGVFCMSIVDAVSKALVGGYSLAQIMFFTRAAGPVFAVALALAQGGVLTLATRRMGWHVVRSIASATTAVTFVAALRLLPLADTVAITFVSPLIMSALSVPMLRERVGPRRWAAILVGLVGVVVVLQPSGAGFGLGPLLALAAAFTYALSLNISRLMSDTESSPSMMFWFSVFMLVGSGLLMPFDWQTPGLFDASLFALLAVSATLGQYFVIQAFRYGQVSLLAPLEYSALIWATAFGFLFWQEFPTPTVLLGAAIIILSSLYVVQREAFAARRSRLDGARPEGPQIKDRQPKGARLDGKGPPSHPPGP
jgi:drug/metabolite transporter (DMT)-like permease